jgi:arylsulfate sulfotransferase
MKPSIGRQGFLGILSLILIIAVLIGARLFRVEPAVKVPQEQTPPTLLTPEVVEAVTEPVGSEPEQDPEAQFKKILSDTLAQIDLQQEVDKNLLLEVKSGGYSFASPLVVVNPYNISPLSALVLFKTATPVNISIHIYGIDALSEVDFTFEGYNNWHFIPVYGLYPGQVNFVTLSSKDANGNTDQVTLEIETEPLPEVLEKTIILTDLPMPDRYQPGFNFTYFNGGIFTKTAFDAHGTYRWFLTNYYNMTSALYANERFILAQGATGTGKLPLWDVVFIEINPLGRIYRVFYAPYSASRYRGLQGQPPDHGCQWGDQRGFHL